MSVHITRPGRYNSYLRINVFEKFLRGCIAGSVVGDLEDINVQRHKLLLQRILDLYLFLYMSLMRLLQIIPVQGLLIILV